MKVVVAVSALALSVSGQTLQNWVPGVCGAGSLTPLIGAGCGVIASDLQPYAPPDPSLYKIKPIVQNVPCEPKCYTPGHETDPDCQYCVFVDPLHKLPYKVPKNIFVEEWTGTQTCYEHSVISKWNDVGEVTGSSHGSSGYFSWSSKVTEKFWSEYFQSYASRSLFVQRYVYHSVVLFPTQTLDQDFELRISLLPTAFNASTQAEFFEFISEYGTHVVDSAFMGGVAVGNAYFVSCMLEKSQGQWVYKEHGSSFFGLFTHDHKSAKGWNHTSGKFYQHSNSSIKLYGGDGSKWGEFNISHPAPTNASVEWADSIYTDMVLTIFHVKPLPELFPSQYRAQAVALNASIQAYFDQLSANNTKKAASFGQRVKPPSWCKDFDLDLERTMAAAAAGDDDDIVPAPLPTCPNFLDELERKRRVAELEELSRDLGITAG